jgi:hypothetical protein
MSLSLDETLHPRLFRAWLEAMPRTVICGKRRSAEYCPIARFLRDQGFKSPIVTTEFVEGQTWQGREMLDCPQWAQMFIWRIDSVGGQPVVRTSTALSNLNGVERDLRGGEPS